MSAWFSDFKTQLMKTQFFKNAIKHLVNSINAVQPLKSCGFKKTLPCLLHKNMNFSHFQTTIFFKCTPKTEYVSRFCLKTGVWLAISHCYRNQPVTISL